MTEIDCKQFIVEDLQSDDDLPDNTFKLKNRFINQENLFSEQESSA